jgi:hypothetical protein
MVAGRRLKASLYDTPTVCPRIITGQAYCIMVWACFPFCALACPMPCPMPRGQIGKQARRRDMRLVCSGWRLHAATLEPFSSSGKSQIRKASMRIRLQVLRCLLQVSLPYYSGCSPFKLAVRRRRLSPIGHIAVSFFDRRQPSNHATVDGLPTPLLQPIPVHIQHPALGRGAPGT